MLINNVKWCNDTSRFPLYTVLLLSSRYCYRISYKIQSNARNMTMKSCTGQQKVIDIITHYPLHNVQLPSVISFIYTFLCLPVVSNFVELRTLVGGRKTDLPKMQRGRVCPVSMVHTSSELLRLSLCHL